VTSLPPERSCQVKELLLKEAKVQDDSDDGSPSNGGSIPKTVISIVTIVKNQNKVKHKNILTYLRKTYIVVFLHPLK
jgi:hypothetical protein